jgi:hypothetical protein
MKTSVPKKTYQKPVIERVSLEPVESLLTACKLTGSGYVQSAPHGFYFCEIDGTLGSCLGTGS